MRKIRVLFLLTLLISSCSAKITDDSLSEKEPMPKTVILNEPYGQDYRFNGRFSSSFDFDMDGREERIYIDSVRTSDYDSDLCVSIGDRSVKASMCPDWLSIMMVYACDINPDDGGYDLAVITNEQSNDPRLRIFRYDKNLTPYSFGEYDDLNSMWIGYIDKCYFNVNDDNTVTLRVGSGAGMWDVMKNYSLNENGEFEEVKPEKGYYEILADHVNSYNMSEEERLKLREGYIMAHCKCSNEQITLNKGDCFKVLYEDFNGNIYIEKENGEGGWMKFDAANNANIRQKLNEYFFYMAG